MSAYLNGNFGYAREDMVILTDDQQNAMSQPTKQNIIRAMHWLVKDAKPNDSLFFHYSGHGGQTPDLDGDEDDGYDEVIYPVDFRVVGHIVDDEMHRIMVQSLQPGVRLTAIFDSCHSGSALDLPYIYSTQGVLKEPNLAKEAGQGLLGLVSAYARGDMSGMANTAMGFLKKATKGGDSYEKTKQTKTSPADVVMWSGSKDTQTSYVLRTIRSFAFTPPPILANGKLTYHIKNSANAMMQQTRCPNCRPSHGRHVLGFHHSAEEEPAAELRAAAEQHPHRAREQIHPETAAELQPSLRQVILLPTLPLPRQVLTFPTQIPISCTLCKSGTRVRRKSMNTGTAA